MNIASNDNPYAKNFIIWRIIMENSASDSMSAKRFCPNCGHEVAQDAVFCPNCGYDLTKNRVESATQKEETAQPQQSQPKPQPQAQPQVGTRAAQKPPMSKRKRGLLIAGGIVLLALIIAGVIGSNYYSRNSQLDRLMAAIKADDDATVAQYVSPEDSQFKVTANSVKPWVKQIRANNYYQTIQKDNLSPSSASDTSYRFIPSGKHLFFFQGYQLTVPTGYAMVTTNQDETDVTVSNRSNLNFSGKVDGKRIGPFIPGDYTFTATAKIKDRTAKAKANYTFDPVADDASKAATQAVDLSIKTISADVLGYPGAVVYVDGDKVGTINDKSVLSLDQLPITRTSKLTQIYTTSNGQKVESRPEQLSDYSDYDEISVGYPGVITHDDADSLLGDVFSSFQTLANDGSDDDEEETLSDHFTNGSSNEFAQSLIKMAHDNYDADGVDYTDATASLEHVTPLAKNRAYIIFSVIYRFRNDDTDQYHVQKYEYNGEIDKVDDSEYRIVKFDLEKKLEDTHQDA